MQRLEIWRTTTFRLTLVYGLAFAIGVVAVLGLTYASTAVFMTRQMNQIVVGQARGLQGVPPRALAETFRQLEEQDVRHVYYFGLFRRDGAWIAGNVHRLPPGTPQDGLPRPLREPGFQPGARALAERLPSGEILFVGFDAKVLSGLRAIILSALLLSGALVIVLGLAVGAALSLAPLRRIRAMQQASQPILDGELSARLPTSNKGDEIDLLAGIANGMMDEVERLLWAVKSVGDNVAHDLRTPLTRLRALLYRVREETGPSAAHADMIDQALSETDALLTRFKALQRISEIDRRERRAGFASVRLQALVEQIGELYAPLAEQHGQRLLVEAEDACEILADRDLLFEAFSNLMSNAVKFTPAGGVVRLKLTRRTEGPRLEVIDTGPGVPEAEREAVLERFYRGREAGRAPGCGLGLSIVAAVARLHNFRLELGDAAPGLRVTLDCWAPAMGR
ncbi:MAG: histidine kinase [Caulobacteraceae bacterium]|nr:histidine kinase [Caulobacteraceae bacterium]